jgi:predicted nucleic acid-binding protein
MAGSFLDSNVLLYLASAEPLKANRAEAVLAAGGTISVQVLNEVANVARRKMAMSWEEVRIFLAGLRALLETVPLTTSVHDRGLELAERHGLSVYDALIVAAALEAGCDTLYSEDMQHGMRIDKRLTIVNPFV